MRLRRRKAMPEPLSDEELIGLYRADGDPVWVGELFQRYTHMVFLVCMKYLKDELEAEDMSMRVFEKLMSDLRKYEVQIFRGWLHTVVRNQCLLHLERQKRQRERVEAFELDQRAQLLPLSFGEGSGTSQEREAKLSLMEQCLTELKDHQRRCLELFFLQQMSYQEVSDQTGFSLKEVKSHIQNGKRMLRLKMEKEG